MSTGSVILIALVILLTTSPGCARYRAQQAVRAQQDAQVRSTMQQIVVTPGDLSGQPYQVLGPVDYPGPGHVVVSLVGPQTCTPDNARRAALEQYGAVDAIIGFTQWRDGSTAHCGGTAVTYTGR